MGTESTCPPFGSRFSLVASSGSLSSNMLARARAHAGTACCVAVGVSCIVMRCVSMTHSYCNWSRALIHHLISVCNIYSCCTVLSIRGLYIVDIDKVRAHNICRGGRDHGRYDRAR